jgi:two-component system phosphate regulon response regulator PhoB
MDVRGPVLVVEDEADIRNLVLRQLEREGFVAQGASSGPEALEAAQPGTEVCRRLRADPETRSVPVIMLTARGEEIDRVVGFEVGADDYVTKPFSVRELMLRVRAVLRRGSAPGATGEETLLDTPLLRLDVAAHEVRVQGEDVALTATEFRLLETLVRRAGRVQSRGTLLQDVWDLSPNLHTRTVDTHMKRLREKLGPAAAHIETVRGVGYRFQREPSSTTD